MNLHEKSELANSILEEETLYFKDKSIIYSFFNNNENELTKENIETQLTIIDRYYSTNMSRRYYGIEEIAESILQVSNSKNELKNKFLDYANSSNYPKEITKLFSNKFGYNKKGKKYGKAISLISKYAYFITGFNFPIYDSIVMEVYPLIKSGKQLSKNNIEIFIEEMLDLLSDSQIESFNKLDNLLWLIGKINRGNYSLILNKSEYLELVGRIDLVSLKSEKIDKKIRDFVNENIENLSDIFTPNQRKMIIFSKGLTKTLPN